MKRRNFSQQQIREVFESQGGICAMPECGANLAQTDFQRHHIDGNPENIHISNLELLCPRHHRLTFGDKEDKHEVTEKETMDNLRELITQGLHKELTGAHIQYLLDAIELRNKISYRLYRAEDAPEQADWLDKLQSDVELQQYRETYLKGWTDGLASATRLIAEWSKGITIDEKETIEEYDDENIDLDWKKWQREGSEDEKS